MGGEPAKGLETRRQAGDRSRTHCLARHAGRLGAGTARGGAGPLADATPAPVPRAGTGPALRAGVPAGGARAGSEEAGGGPLADSLPRSARGPAGSRHCERRRGTARGRDSCTCAAGRHRAGGVPAGAGTEEAGGGPLADSASLGPRAGWEPAPRGEGERAAGGRRTAFPQGTPSCKLAGGLAGHWQPRALETGRRRLASGGPGGLSGGRRAGGRTSADRGPGEGQGGRKVSSRAGMSRERVSAGGPGLGVART